MTKIDILTKKLEGFTPEDKGVIRYILAHGNPQRSELGKEFDMKLVDEATRKGIAANVIALDPATYRYSVPTNFQDSAKELLAL